jgi:fatty-acyl-CoA synthase
MALHERYSGLTVAAALANRATVDPERPFILYGDQTLTFGQVDSRAEALAASLHALGIGAGDRVALVMPAWPEFVISLFAAAKLGAVVVPLNPRLTTPELQYMLRHSEAAAAIALEEYQGVDYLHLFEEMMSQLPELQYLVTVGEEDLWYDDRIFQFEDLLSAGGGRDFEAPSVAPDSDTFAIFYTSGTTGKPKGVELTQANLLHGAAQVVEALGLSADDRLIGVTGLFHVFGMGPGVFGALLSGASLVLQEAFDGGATLDLVADHGVTVHFGVPSLFRTEVHEQERKARDLSSLRVLLSAGAPMPDDLLNRVRALLCEEVLTAYALTETGGPVAMTQGSDPDDKKRFTVGRPFEGTLIRVLGPEGSELPVESLGEIAIQGPGVMRGYYRQPRQTASVTDEGGFLLTGDLGILDEAGYLHLVGRRKEVIIRSGFSVHPREVEERILAHPAVDEAAVVGIPDDVLGEALCACVVPVEGAIVTGEEIISWCGITLADYKSPDLVRFLDAFPLTGTGKVRRVELARMIRAEELSRKDP